MHDNEVSLAASVVVAAQPGWRIHYVSPDDGPDDAEDFARRVPDVVVAWYIEPCGWTWPLAAGEQFAIRQEFILRDPDGNFVTSGCGNFRSLDEAYRTIRPVVRK
jgi:hypothetical protein